MTDDPEFEARVRRELREHVEHVEPRGSLAALRELITRRGRHRRRRLHKAARSVPEPPTERFPAVVVAGPVVRHSRPAAAWRRCHCGRPTLTGFCCWPCMTAAQGGWIVGIHTPACEQRARPDRMAAYRDAAWHGASR